MLTFWDQLCAFILFFRGQPELFAIFPISISCMFLNHTDMELLVCDVPFYCSNWLDCFNFQMAFDNSVKLIFLLSLNDWL